MWFALMIYCSSLAQESIQIDERIRVSFVSLDVVANHKKGGLITDLTVDDFVVKENGKTVPITYFEIRDFREEALQNSKVFLSEADFLPKNQPFQQVIFVLDLEAARDNQPFIAMDQLEAALKRMQGQPSYRVALYSMETGMMTDGFESEIGLVLQKLSDYRRNYSSRGAGNPDNILFPKEREKFKIQTGRGGNMSQLDTEIPDLNELEKAFQFCLNHMDTMERINCIRMTLDDFIEWHSVRTERVIGELESLAYAFEENDDLKIMMLISPGFGLNRLDSAQKLARVYRDQAEGRQNSPRNSIQDMASSETRLNVDQNFKRVLHACIRNRVIFNTFDLFNNNTAMNRRIGASQSSIGPAMVVDAFRQYQRDMTEGLRELADESGGTFRATGVFADSATEVLERNRFFYVIGYNSPPGKPGRFRNIKLKVKRKKTVLNYRTGYFGN